MTKKSDSDNTLGILGVIALIAIIAIVGLILIFPSNFALPEMGAVNGNETPIATSTPTPAASPTAIAEQADLRIVALPYIAASDIENTCTLLGGTWHYDADFIGCTGIPVTTCTTAVALSGMAQCLEVDAEWYCGSEGVWCKYN